MNSVTLFFIFVGFFPGYLATILTITLSGTTSGDYIKPLYGILQFVFPGMGPTVAL